MRSEWILRALSPSGIVRIHVRSTRGQFCGRRRKGRWPATARPGDKIRRGRKRSRISRGSAHAAPGWHDFLHSNHIRFDRKPGRFRRVVCAPESGNHHHDYGPEHDASGEPVPVSSVATPTSAAHSEAAASVSVSGCGVAAASASHDFASHSAHVRDGMLYSRGRRRRLLFRR